MWAVHVSRMVRMINSYHVLKRKSKGKRPLFWGAGTLAIDQNLIRIQTLNKFSCEDVGWFHVRLWRVLLNRKWSFRFCWRGETRGCYIVKKCCIPWRLLTPHHMTSQICFWNFTLPSLYGWWTHHPIGLIVLMRLFFWCNNLFYF
jgi:hypothetical protein